MLYYVLKITITTISIVAISEISKRSSFVAALFASLPLVSILAITWLYIDTKDVVKASELTTGIFWLVLPSLTLFVSLPFFLKQGWNFYLSMMISIFFTGGCYWLMLAVLNRFGIKL